jgi:hypothetical protein
VVNDGAISTKSLDIVHAFAVFARHNGDNRGEADRWLFAF